MNLVESSEKYEEVKCTVHVSASHDIDKLLSFQIKKKITTLKQN